MKTVALFLLLIIIPSGAMSYVYSVDGLIDVDRMATDKMYYDFYYNPQTRIFQRNDTQPISPIAQSLLKKAIEAKIDRGVGADQAYRAEYNRIMTGTNNCQGDPYVGSGTDVNPETQSPGQPKCTTGGAAYADESIGYVYMIDGAYRTENAKEVTDSFRTQVYNNPVPRVFEAPSSNYAYVGERYIIHNSDGMVWRDGVPVGLEVMNWTGNCPGGVSPRTGKPCYTLVNDGGKVLSTDEAHWADKAVTAQMLGQVDFSRVKIDQAKITLNQDRQGNILQRNYTFLIDNYTVTKGNVQFCDIGWGDGDGGTYTNVPDLGAVKTIDFCGGSCTCNRGSQDGCNAYDPNDPTKCTAPTYTYNCSIDDACYNSDLTCRNIVTGSISVSNQPVTVSITLPGSDTRLEPPNPDTGLIYQAAQQQLPGLVTINGKNREYKITEITKCDGSQNSYWNCH